MKHKKIVMLFAIALCWVLLALTVVGSVHQLGQINTLEETDKVLAINAPQDGPLKIAQFADLHFGTPGKNYHNNDEERTIAYMQYIVNTTKPHLIVCSGDNIMSTGVEGVKKFIALMDTFQTPWTFIFGNHDAELHTAGYSKKEVSNALCLSNSPYLLYKDDHVETGRENRYGNFSIVVNDHTGKKMFGAIVLVDSGTYMYDVQSYQSITQGQMDWYVQQIDTLQSTYSAQTENAHDIVPTIVFGHMQLPEFFVAYNKAQNNDGAELVIQGGRVGARDAEQQSPSFFDVIKQKQSTKAYFVGHMHGLKFQVKMDGVLMGFGPQTGFSYTQNSSNSARNTYVYSVAHDFSITTHNCQEVVE